MENWLPFNYQQGEGGLKNDWGLRETLLWQNQNPPTLPTLSHVINDDCSLISKFVEEYLYPPTMASGTTSVFPGKEIQDHGNSSSMGIWRIRVQISGKATW